MGGVSELVVALGIAVDICDNTLNSGFFKSELITCRASSGFSSSYPVVCFVVVAGSCVACLVAGSCACCACCACCLIVDCLVADSDSGSDDETEPELLGFFFFKFISPLSPIAITRTPIAFHTCISYFLIACLRHFC